MEQRTDSLTAYLHQSEALDSPGPNPIRSAGAKASKFLSDRSNDSIV